MRNPVVFLTITIILYLQPCNILAKIPNNNIDILQFTNEIKNFAISKLTEQYTGNIIVELLQTHAVTQLKKCDIPLEYSFQEQFVISSRATIKAICNGNNPWTFYIPISLKIYQPVVVTNRPMSKDELITTDTISLKEVDITNLNQGFFSDPNLAVGQISRFPMKAGSILTPQSIVKNKLIKRGDRLNIIVEDAELSVYMQGESLEDGSLGDNIKVRNISSKKIIEATIVAPGKVQIHMPL
jgi:flagella basal body P-ring formation protein FlgA